MDRLSTQYQQNFDPNIFPANQREQDDAFFNTKGFAENLASTLSHMVSSLEKAFKAGQEQIKDAAEGTPSSPFKG